MAVAKRPTKKVASGLTENSTPSEVLAHTIVSEFSDLAPSVRRIMDAPLDESGRFHALTLFHDSLGVQGDPMRNPNNAVAAAQLLGNRA